MLILRTLIVLVLASCATDPERTYQRQDSAAERMENFREFQKRCRAEGGSVDIRRRGNYPGYCMKRFCPPGPFDKMTCIK